MSVFPYRFLPVQPVVFPCQINTSGYYCTKGPVNFSAYTCKYYLLPFVLLSVYILYILKN
jgi:hypothetical protein